MNAQKQILFYLMDLKLRKYSTQLYTIFSPLKVATKGATKKTKKGTFSKIGIKFQLHTC